PTPRHPLPDGLRARAYSAARVALLVWGRERGEQNAPGDDLAHGRARRGPVQVQPRPPIPAVLQPHANLVPPSGPLDRPGVCFRRRVARVVKERLPIDPQSGPTEALGLEAVPTARRHVDTPSPFG